jgi:hypothetical protein
VITPSEISAEFLKNYLKEIGFEKVLLEIVSPSLEDVFLTLARKGESNDLI